MQPVERSAGRWEPGAGRRRGFTVACPPIPEKMVTSEALGGVPILVLANKQDVEVSLPCCQGEGYLLQEGLPLWDTPRRVGCRALQRPAVQGAFSPLGGGRALSQLPAAGASTDQGSSSGEKKRDPGARGASTPRPETWQSGEGHRSCFRDPGWPDPRLCLGDCPCGWTRPGRRPVSGACVVAVGVLGAVHPRGRSPVGLLLGREAAVAPTASHPGAREEPWGTGLLTASPPPDLPVHP